MLFGMRYLTVLQPLPRSFVSCEVTYCLQCGIIWIELVMFLLSREISQRLVPRSRSEVFANSMSCQKTENPTKAGSRESMFRYFNSETNARVIYHISRAMVGPL
jgi:hypothetical protein